jgi:hypothetical protein
MKKLWLIFYFIPTQFAQARRSEKSAMPIEIGDLAINSLYQYQPFGTIFEKQQKP